MDFSQKILNLESFENHHQDLKHRCHVDMQCRNGFMIHFGIQMNIYVWLSIPLFVCLTKDPGGDYHIRYLIQLQFYLSVIFSSGSTC